MRELIRRLRLCIHIMRYGDADLIDPDTLAVYEADEEWNNMWDITQMPIEDNESGVFPGLSEYVCRGEAGMAVGEEGANAE